ncbi:atypical PIKK FRAP protein kinase [Ramaria rubella]|nr:atypical PIKK FRAP protein kinase [Ramaria rubella]
MHIAASKDSDVDQIFIDICEHQESSRRDAMNQLHDYVISHALPAVARSSSPNDWEEEVGKKLIAMTQSRSIAQRRGVILAIDVILDIIKEDPQDNSQTFFRFYNNLVTLLHDTRETSLVIAASQSIGRLAQFSGTALGDHFIEELIPNFLEMAFSDANSLYGAVLVLKEFARHSALSFSHHIFDTFRCASGLLRNTEVDVRIAAAQLIGYLLTTMGPREFESHRVTITSLVVRVQQGLESNSSAVLHGSLLALRELFYCSDKELLDGRFLDMCEAVLRFRSHADPAVRTIVIAMLPTLASYDHNVFCDLYLTTSMEYLVRILDSVDGPTAYLAIGHLSTVVGEKMILFIDPIFQGVRHTLQKYSDKTRVPLDHVFESIGLLTSALGPSVTQTISSHLTLIFTAEISDAFVHMLEVIVRKIPTLHKSIQVLSGQHYRAQGAPQSSIDVTPSGAPIRSSSCEKIILALTALRTFNFHGHILNEFIVNAVVPHLDAEEATTRKAAALTTCRLLARDPVRFQSSRHSVELITSTLDKLLSVGIVDSVLFRSSTASTKDPSVRGMVLSSLEPNLDYQLAQAEYVRLLVIALHDETVDNRVLAVRVVGRLVNYNPGQVLPPLRKTLIRLLTELKCSVGSQTKECAIRILEALVACTPAVVEQYVYEVLEILLDCARDANQAITTHVLLSLGHLTAVPTVDISHQTPRIMAIILASIEGNSQMRSAALDCLGKICTNTGYVIAPIEDYPQLLPMLHGMLKREQSSSVRLAVIKVIGLLGALDPDRYQVRVQGVILMESPPETINAVTDVDATDMKAVVAPDDPHQELVLNLLLDVLKQQSLNSHHHLVIDSLITIAKSRGTKFASAVPKIMPAFCTVIRGAVANLQGYYLGHLTFLVRSIQQHIRVCVTVIVELIHELWNITSQRLALVVLVEALADVLASEFGPYTARLIPKLLLVLQETRTELFAPIQARTLSALAAFSYNLQEYLNLVVPIFISCYERSHTPRILRKQAIQSLAVLSATVDLYPFTSRIVHSLTSVMADTDESLRQSILDALFTFTYTLGPNFVIFVPVLTKALADNNLRAQKHLCIFARLLKREPLPPVESEPRIDEAPPATAPWSPNQLLLKRAWDITRVLDNHDAWIAWFTQLAAQFVKESPSISLRSCMHLFDVYPHISPHLFNPALASCWGELTEPLQEDLIHSVQHVLTSSSVPPEVAHYMLDLVEYMERNETPLPISHSSMADYCFHLQAYAKALHHRELQFFQDFASTTIEALIDINAMLRQSDAALGTLNLACQHYNVRNPETWYEKLGQWDDALRLYETMGQQSCDSQDNVLEISFVGRLRCLHALGKWEQVTALTAQKWPYSGSDLQSQLAPIGAAGAWHTGAWTALQTYYSAMEVNSGDRAFYEAVSAIQRNRLPHAMVNILKARDLLDPELTSLLDESPDRLDRFAVQAQMISELEEMVLYKKLADKPQQQQRLRETWKKRLMGCQRDLNVWQRILKVRSLAVKPDEDIDTIVRFANLCRKAGRLGAAQRAMETLVLSGENEEPQSKAPPQIVYAQLKLIWAKGDCANALNSLRKFIHELSQDPQTNDLSERKTLAHITARCHLKHGNWQMQLDGGLTTTNAGSVLNSYHLATKHDPKWSKAWHTWALSNLDVIRNSTAVRPFPGDRQPVPNRTHHIVAAIEGFFRSLALVSENELQDTLSLLTLWFKFGAQSDITIAMVNGFKTVTCDMWLDVVPQIIARIQTPTPIVRSALTRLLTDIGLEHPQALIFPLTVGAKSPSLPRQRAALEILNQMSSHSRTLVEQGKLVARELSRIAINWGELWYEALQKSGRDYFSGNSKGMLDGFQPLYDVMQNPSTPFEVAFIDVLGPRLFKARALCLRHISEGDKKALKQAWEIYLGVYQQLEAFLPEIQASTRERSSKSLDLHSVSPILLHAVNMELAVPGTYLSGRSVITISSFKHDIPTIKTKQRPRRLFLLGSNGQQFVYLLKGREDLRQDERVMQVIGLMNTLLARDRESLKRRLHLQRYTVIPLAPDVGLIGWMAKTDPLQNLISDYRTAHKILPDLEHKMMLQDEPEYDQPQAILLSRKLQVFESAMNRTTGQDLYRIFWLKSDSSEAWVTRRTTYTRSLAVGNMICYLLGVGDRHPGNIMIERNTGKVIHIDFGDCFEVSFERDSLPEKVPFRLTRMLRHAMEVCGIQGGFKTSCEISMVVLRDNKESLLAVLEALVYDPLINWRLIRAENHVPAAVASSFGTANDGPNKRTVLNENEILDDATAEGTNREVRNERALAVYSRVEDKLTGRDFDSDHILTVTAQVEKLVQQAISNENLCQHFYGWCPFW